MADPKKLFLSVQDRKIAGVCGGLGEYFEKDATLFRVLFVAGAILSGGLVVLVYLAMWLIIPRKKA
jgi:phage shock protein PspC (stress-responsive transcriptional regulator)